MGDAVVGTIILVEMETGTLQVISATDCIMDRLAHYFHWGDRQCLEQASLVALHNEVDLEEVHQRARAEGMEDEFNEIENRLKKAS